MRKVEGDSIITLSQNDQIWSLPASLFAPVEFWWRHPRSKVQNFNNTVQSETKRTKETKFFKTNILSKTSVLIKLTIKSAIIASGF